MTDVGFHGGRKRSYLDKSLRDQGIGMRTRGASSLDEFWLDVNYKEKWLGANLF